MSKSGRIQQDTNSSKTISVHPKFLFGRFLRIGLVVPLALVLSAETVPAGPG
jgi:hypothetical protein